MTLSSTLTVRPMRDSETRAVIALWERCGLTRPQNDPERDIALARSGPASDILVGLAGDHIRASIMVGHDGHRGAVYYVAADPHAEGSGFGRVMMDAAEAWLTTRGIWKLNLLVRASNQKVHGFYQALGYETVPRTVFSKRLGAAGVRAES